MFGMALHAAGTRGAYGLVSASANADCTGICAYRQTSTRSRLVSRCSSSKLGPLLLLLHRCTSIGYPGPARETSLECRAALFRPDLCVSVFEIGAAPPECLGTGARIEIVSVLLSSASCQSHRPHSYPHFFIGGITGSDVENIVRIALPRCPVPLCVSPFPSCLRALVFSTIVANWSYRLQPR